MRVSVLLFAVTFAQVEMGVCVNEREAAQGSLRELLAPNTNDSLIDELIDRFTQTPGAVLSSEEAERLNRTVILPLKDIKIALVVVDFQNDFVSGSLSIKEGDAGEEPLDALPSLNRLVQEGSADMIVYTQDWHPSNHISFYEHARNSDRELAPDDKTRKLRPFDIVRFEKPDTIQVLYPTHCVQGSWGAQLHPQLVLAENATYVRKGMDVYVDSYSAFGDNHGKKKSELEHLLRSDGITAVMACGLAYDICVMNTLKDSANLGFMSAIITDCSKGLSIDKMQEADDLFLRKGVARVSADDASDILNRKYVPFEWADILSRRASR